MSIGVLLDALEQQPQRFYAMATVVAVEGSAYRRAGARMLIARTGGHAGSISGGCLETDVIEHARALQPGSVKLVRYDTRADEDLVWGTATGCNGLITILIERWNDGEPPEYLRRLREALARGPVVLATRLDGREPRLLNADPLIGNESRLATIDGAETFLDLIRPAPSLVIFGTGDDATPVARFAEDLGWQVTMVDQKPANGVPSRTRLIICALETWAEAVTLCPADSVVIMTHHFEKDLAALTLALTSEAQYVGLLGARKRTQRLIEELGGGFDLSRLHSPIGLDLGAETPEEIALAIVAEVMAATADRTAGFLRDGSLRSPLQRVSEARPGFRAQHLIDPSSAIDAKGVSS